jgi:glycylpeptide N-tetradecanoyltransferase
VLSSFVVQEGQEIVGFISFYHLPSSILRLKNPEYKNLNAAYSYYMIPGKYTLLEMYESALILAKTEGFDVFNALDILDNKTIFEELLFKPGDGFLHYYLYNWKLKTLGLVPELVGKVLV